jgi:hypothetical protein
MMVIKKTQNITSYSNIKKKINNKIVFRTTILAKKYVYIISLGEILIFLSLGNFRIS